MNRLLRVDTLRTRVLLLVAGVGILPLLLLTLWLTRAAAAGGERLLRDRLQLVLIESERQIASRWAEERSRILSLAEHGEVQRELRGPLRTAWHPAALRTEFARLPPDVLGVTIIDTAGVARWSVTRSDVQGDPAIDVDEPIYGLVDGTRLGVLRARLRLQALLPPRENTTAGLDAAFGVIDRASRRSLLPLPFDSRSFLQSRFTWGEDEWVAERREMEDPPFTLLAFGPITLLTKPFRAAAARGFLLVLVIGAAGLLLAVLVSRRLARSLEELQAAATAVARGDLERSVEVGGTVEVQQVAAAFNAMSHNLRRSLDAAAQREALAAVGGFATELAHEIRNPLGAMRLDLELIEEQLPDNSPLRALQRNAIGEIERLDQVVGGALDLARSGRVVRGPVALADPLRSAVHYATPRFEQRGSRLTLRVPDIPVVVLGDAHALQRIFLNVLLNAADAVPNGGRCDVVLEVIDTAAFVRIADNGPGIDSRAVGRVGEPFFSTKPAGTGLGLAIATRIAHAHGGELTIEGTRGVGTTVQLRLPLANGSSGHGM